MAVVHTCVRAVLKVDCWFAFRFSSDLGLLFVRFFYHFVSVLFAFVVLDLVSSVLSEEIC